MEKSADNFVGSSLENGVVTRHRLLQGVVTVFASAAVATKTGATALNQSNQSPVASAADVPYSSAVLPVGIRSRFVDNSNGIRMHTLEAGFEVQWRPLVELVQGYPVSDISWS